MTARPISAIGTDCHGSGQSTDSAEKFVSIVVPCLNEELVIGEFVDWCFEGLRRAGVAGEVLIIDSSTDRSPEIAEQKGARVLRARSPPRARAPSPRFRPPPRSTRSSRRGDLGRGRGKPHSYEASSSATSRFGATIR